MTVTAGPVVSPAAVLKVMTVEVAVLAVPAVEAVVAVDVRWNILLANDPCSRCLVRSSDVVVTQLRRTTGDATLRPEQ